MLDDFYNVIVCCRMCKQNELVPVLDLGPQALASSFPRADEPDPPSAPLELVKCENCGLVQLRHTVRPSYLYTVDYGYRSGTNASMRNHLSGIAQWAEARVTLEPGDIVIDIGSNDATLLKSYAKAGLQRYGIDPIIQKFLPYYQDDCFPCEGFFNRSLLEKHKIGKAKVITSISMFYDLDDPDEFVAHIHDALAHGGVWILEQSYLPSMLATHSFDTICHEHLEYYALAQIEWLAKRHGLRVFDVELNSCNGGSFRLALCHIDDPRLDNIVALDTLRASEAALRLTEAHLYQEFGKTLRLVISHLIEFIDSERAKGKRFYLYGASTKGNTLLQYCDLNSARIVAAAERNPEKWGRRTPRTNIPIISEEQARLERPDYFLVLPWHFRDEFVVREAAYLKAGGKMVFPLPRFEIV